MFNATLISLQRRRTSPHERVIHTDILCFKEKDGEKHE